MNWELQWGERRLALEQIEKETGITPDALRRRPLPTQFEQSFYNAFVTLSGSRQITAVGPMAIPLSEIKSFFELYEITDTDEQDEYLELIQTLDKAYLERSRNKNGAT